MALHDFGARVHESTKLLRAAIPSSVEVAVDVPSAPVTVKCDPSALQQVRVQVCRDLERGVSACGAERKANAERPARALLTLTSRARRYR